MEKMDNFTYMSAQKIKYSIFIANNKNTGNPCKVPRCMNFGYHSSIK